MTKRILKYQFNTNERVMEVKLPKGADIMFFSLQMKVGYVLWVEADESRPNEIRKFILLKTGERVPKGSAYISTINTAIPVKGQGEIYLKPVVWHLYELDVKNELDGVTILENLNMN